MKQNFIYPLCAVGLGLVLLSGGALAADAPTKPVKPADPEALGQEIAVLTQAPNVPPPIKRRHSAKIIVNLEVKEITKRLADVITVLNAEGEIVYQQPGLNLPTDEIVAKLKTISQP
jgi:nitrite reductase (NO-forming)